MLAVCGGIITATLEFERHDIGVSEDVQALCRGQDKPVKGEHERMPRLAFTRRLDLSREVVGKTADDSERRGDQNPALVQARIRARDAPSGC